MLGFPAELFCALWAYRYQR